MDWIRLAQDRDKSLALAKMVILMYWYKKGNFFSCLRHEDV